MERINTPHWKDLLDRIHCIQEEDGYTPADHLIAKAIHHNYRQTAKYGHGEDVLTELIYAKANDGDYESAFQLVIEKKYLDTINHLRFRKLYHAMSLAFSEMEREFISYPILYDEDITNAPNPDRPGDPWAQ